MSPREITSAVRRELPLLRDDDTIRAAVEAITDAGAPALPVVDAERRLRGIFGEREFIGALFPGYLGTLGSAGFVPKSLEQVLEKRSGCATEAVARYMNTEHIDVDDTRISAAARQA